MTTATDLYAFAWLVFQASPLRLPFIPDPHTHAFRYTQTSILSSSRTILRLCILLLVGSSLIALAQTPSRPCEV